MATPTVGENIVRIPIYAKGGVVVAYAIVDAEDGHMARHRWNMGSRGYAVRSKKMEGRRTRLFLMHRELVGLAHGDPRVTDHINHDKLDNRRCNLRITDAAGNAANRTVYRNSKSGVRGVHLTSRRDGWEASFNAFRIRYRLGTFPTAEEAELAVMRKRVELGLSI